MARERKSVCPCLCHTRTTHTLTQEAREFESVCPSLKVDSFYNGVGGNIKTIRDGIDVVIGTPGRMIDLVERGALKLDKVRHRCVE